MPIKMTSREFRRLTRGVSAERIADPSLGDLMLLAWDAWEIGKGRRRTMEDIAKYKGEILRVAQKYSKKPKKGKTK
jgi:hypothetical protein